MYVELEGDLIELSLNHGFDVIAHGCNCLSTMGAGIALQMKKAFGCDKFKMELSGPNINKLGCIDYEGFKIVDNHAIKSSLIDSDLIVVNAYTQYRYGMNHFDGQYAPLDYEALTLCLRKMNKEFNGMYIGLPKIGTHLAGGDWNIIKQIIKKELIDCHVTVVIYNK